VDSSPKPRRNQWFDTEAARLASDRAASAVHGEMKRGLGTLATIAVTAPWIGVAGTITGMAASWVGYVGQKSAFMAQVSWRLTASMWSTALGIIVALAALYSYRYLRDKVEAFDSEMRAASLDLLNQLSRR